MKSQEKIIKFTVWVGSYYIVCTLRLSIYIILYRTNTTTNINCVSVMFSYNKDNVTYGAEERDTEVTNIIEAAVYEIPLSEHDYEVTGTTNMYEYATLGPNKEAVSSK